MLSDLHMNVWQFLQNMHIHMRNPGVVKDKTIWWSQVRSAIPANALLTFNDPLNPPLQYISHKQDLTLGSRESNKLDLIDPWTIFSIRYDDLGPRPDNYRDLIIDANPAYYRGENGWYAVFWCEGSVEKWVCYNRPVSPVDPTRLIHHYSTSEPLQHYGIFHTADLSQKGPCPFPDQVLLADAKPGRWTLKLA